ncbi:BCCT family transporter [Zooshikella ganghwensis]|uniref:BCCT family transporter n=1 Tax=Zooshikella ganghwensis TaxID=202772 RepID=UPI0004280B34|nr:BCCT family transporter [Zooshikella ganghwensis]
MTDQHVGHKSTSLRDWLEIDVHPQVFGFSALAIFAFVFLSLTNLEQASELFSQTKAFITDNFGWLFILLVQVFLVFALYLAFSRFGYVRLGGAQAKPKYSFPGWFAMLFSAGMGIGLVFWSVAEPIYHFASPPVGEGHTINAAKTAMDITFLHWGFHAWGIYAVVGLSLAYFTFNKKLPLTIRSAFYPLIGEKIYGPIGHAIDVLAVIATLFGVATSLGLGVNQIAAGLEFLFDIKATTGVKLALIAGITILATISVVKGLDKGIKRLSEINLWAAAGMLLFVIIVGPTLFVLSGFVQNIGHYMQNLLMLSSWTETYQQNSQWQSSWTVFYWAWWIAWSPFVGMFIARISYGRTIRQFVLGVLLVPSVLTFLWITVFGGAALHNELFGLANIETAVKADLSTSLFVLLEGFPLASITSMLAVFLIVIFFVTSSDSGSLVIDIITSGGNLNPPVAQRVFWATTEGVVAAVLLLGGGLTALQTASITTGLPFAIVLFIMCFGLLKSLHEEFDVKNPIVRK